MKQKPKMNDFSLDEELLKVFKNVFSDDEDGYNEAVRDAKKAFTFIRKIEFKRNPNYEFKSNDD